MSNKALNWAWDAPIEHAGAKFVLVCLADHAGDAKPGADWQCFPAISTIMQMTSQGERTVERHLKWLVDEQWISRARRGARTREDAVYDYTLHRCRADQPPDNLAGEACGSPAKLAGDERADHPPISTRPPANFDTTTRQFGAAPTPPNKDEPPENPQRTGVCVGVRDATFTRLCEAWVKAAPGRLAEGKAAEAFDAACGDGVDPELIVGGAARFLSESRDAKAGRVPLLHNWIADRRWRGYEPIAVAAATTLAAFDGPDWLVAAVRAMRDDAWIAAYLSPAGWDGEARAILARTDYAAGKLRDLRRLLVEHEITVIVRKP